MITFVYCCVCLLIVCCHTTRTGSEEYGYNNDSPDTLPDVQFLRCKPGADVSMMCNKHHPNKDNITWEFKHCRSNYQKCETKNMYKLDYSEGEWKKLDYNRKRKKLEIKNATEDSVGVYRCLYNYSVIKVYVLDLTVTKFSGPAPKIVSLTPSSNSTITTNTPLTIQCKATSVQPAEIRWFKECNGGVKGDVAYDGKCYSALPLRLSNSLYFNNMYHSKLTIYSSRSIDSGTYVCVVINVYDEDHKNITIKVDDITRPEDKRSSFSLLFLIPLILILVPISIWLCCGRRKKKNQRHSVEIEHQKQLIQPVVEFDVALN